LLLPEAEAETVESHRFLAGPGAAGVHYLLLVAPATISASPKNNKGDPDMGLERLTSPLFIDAERSKGEPPALNS
jgi:hypothetical protein